jgi:hypothetical protein
METSTALNLKEYYHPLFATPDSMEFAWEQADSALSHLPPQKRIILKDSIDIFCKVIEQDNANDFFEIMLNFVNDKCGNQFICYVAIHLVVNAKLKEMNLI